MFYYENEETPIAAPKWKPRRQQQQQRFNRYQKQHSSNIDGHNWRQQKPFCYRDGQQQQPAEEQMEPKHQPAAAVQSQTPQQKSNRQFLHPNVAKLLNGELIDGGAKGSGSSYEMMLQKCGGHRSPVDYAEHIKICVANPGRFLGTWALLIQLFGENRLYEFVRKCAWSEAELAHSHIDEDNE